MSKNIPTINRLRECLDYDPGTGLFVWKFREGARKSWNQRWAGRPAFAYIDKRGYAVGAVDGKNLTAHRVAWAITQGVWPSHDIDHIDGDKVNNRIANLRDVPHILNQRNMCRPRSNTSGHIGVGYHRRDRRYRAYIEIDGKSIHLGNFKTIDEAVAARAAAQSGFGFLSGHGKEAA